MKLQFRRPSLPRHGILPLLLGGLGALSGCAQLLGIEETNESPCYPKICDGTEGSGSGASGGADANGGAEAAAGGVATGGGAKSGGESSMGGSPIGSGGAQGGSSNGGTGEEASGGAPSTGGADQGGTGGDGAGGGTGGQAQRGPVLIEVDGFFIDATEVTNFQYEEFLASKDGDTSGQPAECAFNDVYTPSDAWPNEADLPVTYVDWCDARAFCDWAGKRLCGGIDGSQLTDANLREESVSEWYRACAGPSPTSINHYPYGSTYQEVCNDDAYQLANGYPGPVPVGSLDQCEGSPSGVFDMVGNVVEWIDRCDGATGPDDECSYIGGSYVTDGDSSSSHCASGASAPAPRSQSASALGFRCCAD